jgi:hypothetical protein
MTQQSANATISLYPNKSAKLRLFALWYFAMLMILWNIAGHTILGFEQAWAHPIVAVASACLVQVLLEWIDASTNDRVPRFVGGIVNLLNFLLPAMISGFACAMLLYPNDRLMPIVFASVLAVCSKSLVRVRLPNGAKTHVLNPSNFGIITTLWLFPWVGQAPPYQFTENITGFWHWALPAAILVTGIIVHGFATGRLPLCIAWLVAFVIQGVIRAWLAGNDWFVPLMPMSSAAFILFTLYMIPDPATTPIATGRQVLFGASVAIVYAVIQLMHIVFGLFLALTIVCAARGVIMFLSRRPAVAFEVSSAVVPVSQLAMASSDSASAA